MPSLGMVNEPTGKKQSTPLPEMAQLAKLIMRNGPDIDNIARISGQYKETIRYRYKEKILKKGFALQAIMDYEGLGLRRVVMKVRVNSTYASYAREMFAAMNKLCYVTSFTFLLPEGLYMIHANVPKAFKASFVDFMGKLKEMGIFDTLEVYTFDWFRNIPMRAEYYDFDHGVWDYDWTRKVEPSKDEVEQTSAELTYDKVDLLILKEMHADATRSISEIRDAIKATDGIDINYKTLAWHWIKHVQEKKMIRGYRLNWMGTRYDFVADKPKQRPHKYVLVSVFVRDVNQAERASLRSEMNKVPFLWCEAVGDDYHAQLAFPVEMVNDAFSFLETPMSRFGDRASYHVMDQSNAINFSISYQLFDNSEREWKMDVPDLISRFQNLVLKIGENSEGNRSSA
jgi:DNA-binding Lrp family transcriptional regulator